MRDKQVDVKLIKGQTESHIAIHSFKSMAQGFSPTFLLGFCFLFFSFFCQFSSVLPVFLLPISHLSSSLKIRQSVLLFFVISSSLGNQKIKPLLFTYGRDTYCTVTMHQYTGDLMLS